MWTPETSGGSVVQWEEQGLYTPTDLGATSASSQSWVTLRGHLTSLNLSITNGDQTAHLPRMWLDAMRWWLQRPGWQADMCKVLRKTWRLVRRAALIHRTEPAAGEGKAGTSARVAPLAHFGNGSVGCNRFYRKELYTICICIKFKVCLRR